MNVSWIEKARQAFSAVYGAKKGPAVCGAVIPGIMGDFRGMLLRADAGVVIREDYRTDDRKTEIHIEGRRDGDALTVTALSIGGRTIDLDGGLKI